MAAYNAGVSPITRWNSEIRYAGDPLLWRELQSVARSQQSDPEAALSEQGVRAPELPQRITPVHGGDLREVELRGR